MSSKKATQTPPPSRQSEMGRHILQHFQVTDNLQNTPKVYVSSQFPGTEGNTEDESHILFQELTHKNVLTNNQPPTSKLKP